VDQETGYANWDCHDSLDMEAFISALRHVRNNNGELPPTLNSIQDKNELGESGVSAEVVQIMREEAAGQSLVNKDTILCLVDGFLLYSDPGVVRELDIRFLVRAPYEKLKARREARSGYVTLEGKLSVQLE
jgi:nicotinamide/nicotinate riboside kinase